FASHEIPARRFAISIEIKVAHQRPEDQAPFSTLASTLLLIIEAHSEPHKKRNGRSRIFTLGPFVRSGGLRCHDHLRPMARFGYFLSTRRRDPSGSGFDADA